MCVVDDLRNDSVNIDETPKMESEKLSGFDQCVVKDKGK